MNNKTIKSSLVKITFLVLITACIVLYQQNTNLTEQIRVAEEKLEKLKIFNQLTISKLMNNNN